MSNPKNKAPKPPKAPKAANPAEGLFGSNVQPSMIDINGTEVQLGGAVMRAFEASELTADEWNALPEAEREEQIAAAIEAMRAEPPADKQDEQETEAKAPRIDASLVLIKKHGQPALRIHESALDEHIKLGWQPVAE